jgi:hypothetical protein
MIFKILVYGDQFIDGTLLHSALYATDIPVLRPSDATLESIAKKYVIAMRENATAINTMLGNLQKCKLVDVKLELI